MTLPKIFFSRVVINGAKNIFVLAGTAINKAGFLGPSQVAQNICAVAKLDTVLNISVFLAPKINPSSASKHQHRISPNDIT